MAKNAKKATKKSETEAKATETEKDGVLKINRDDAAKLLRVMGFKETSKYSNELLERRLGKMDQYKANYDGTLDGKTEEQVDKIIAAKGNIKVTGEEPKGTKKPASEKSGDGKAPKDKKAPKAKKERTPGAGTDEWGSRVGSMTAKVNALLQKASKPLSMKEIMEKVGSVGAFSSHLKKMVAAGHVKTDKDGGFVATGK